MPPSQGFADGVVVAGSEALLLLEQKKTRGSWRCGMGENEGKREQQERVLARRDSHHSSWGSVISRNGNKPSNNHFSLLPIALLGSRCFPFKRHCFSQRKRLKPAGFGAGSLTRFFFGD